jgi:RND family efflux transporter MFP subunit
LGFIARLAAVLKCREKKQKTRKKIVSAETDSGDGEKRSVPAMGWPSTISTIVIILGLAAGLISWIYTSEQEAQREGATKQSAMLVEIQTVRRGNFVPRITGLGTVEAAQNIILSPRIEGRVIEISEDFLPGGFVDAGDVLVKIDPSDYQNTVRQRESELQQARSDLEIELGRRYVAKREYELLGKKMTEVNRDLVLREPQLASARASVLSAQVALDQARLELERTSIEAPFNAQILTRNVNVGSQVEPGTGLARLVGIDEYWVIVTVPVAKLDQVAFPRNGEKGSPVRIVNRTAWPEGKYRQGRIKRLIGALDEQTRLARVLVSVSDPLALKESTKGPKMIVGTVVQAEIEGRPLSNVFRINRDHLREEETLWIKKDGKLEIRNAVVVFQDKQYAYLSEGLVNGDQIVTSNLATVAQGVLLRTESEKRDNVKMGK